MFGDPSTKIQSVGYATDLMFAEFDGAVISNRDYVVVRTPNSPGFWWGNFLLYRDPPKAGCLAAWERAFDQAFAGIPELNHRNFAWDRCDGETGDVDAFLKSGYALSRSVFLACHRPVKPPHYNPAIENREIPPSSRNWPEILRLQDAALAPENDTPAFRRFQAQQMNRASDMIRAGMGAWYGAFVNGQLVGAAGIFAANGLARFQSVVTWPSFRRRGVCQSLIYFMADRALVDFDVERTIIMTGVDNEALRVYRSLGFRDIEQVASLSVSTES